MYPCKHRCRDCCGRWQRRLNVTVERGDMVGLHALNIHGEVDGGKLEEDDGDSQGQKYEWLL